jgi:hypothetical protein
MLLVSWDGVAIISRLTGIYASQLTNMFDRSFFGNFGNISSNLDEAIRVTRVNSQQSNSWILKDVQMLLPTARCIDQNLVTIRVTPNNR